VAAVTQAAPTAAAGRAPESAPPEGAAARAEQTAPAEPSRMRLVQMALAFALAWLIVTIVGLRWVRRLREDRAPRSVDDTPLTTR
jgi:hypothetical protein